MKKTSWFFDANEPASTSVLNKILESALRADSEGLRNLPWKAEKDNPLASPALNMDWLVAHPLMPYFVQVIPPTVLYRSLMQNGLEDSLEVLEWLRGEPLKKVLDFDLWTTSKVADFSVSDVAGEKFVEWIKLWSEIGFDFGAERFKELDEETIVLALSSILDIVPSGLTTLKDAELDAYWRTNDDRYYLKMKDGFTSEFDAVQPFIESLYRVDVMFAQTAIGMAAMCVREEAREEGLRWRAARLADAGFIASSEARNVLRYKNSAKLKSQISALVEAQQKKFIETSGSELITEVDPDLVENIYQLFRSQDEDVAARDIVNVLGEEDVKLLVGSKELRPADILDDDDTAFEAAEAIVQKCQSLLLMNDYSTMKSQEQKLLIEKVLGSLAEENLSWISSVKGSLARTANIVAAAFGDTFDADTSSRALAITRGASNIGLELLLQNSEAYGLKLSEDNNLSRGREVFEKLPAETVFQVGWNALMELGIEATEELYEVGISMPQFAKLASNYKVTLEDGETVAIKPRKLLEAGRYAELKRWLSSLETDVSQAAYVVLNGLLNRIPLYSDILDATESSAKASHRPFETLAQVDNVKKFVTQLNLVIE